MLVLSRRLDERIRIGEDIEITVVAISGDQVRLGIEAPRDIKILRSEVYQEVQKQNLAALAAGTAQGEATAAKLREMLGGQVLLEKTGLEQRVKENDRNGKQENE